MKSYYFTEEHELFRQSLRAFIDKEVRPHIDQWETQKIKRRRKQILFTIYGKQVRKEKKNENNSFMVLQILFFLTFF